MFGTYSYNAITRKYVILFGSLFDKIYIHRKDGKELKVPISYGRKERYIEKARKNNDLTKPIDQVWPVMTFRFENFKYDPARKLNNQNYTISASTDNGSVKKVQTPVPYDILVRLSIISRNEDDGLQIIEQILPSFVPEVSTNILHIDDIGSSHVIPITLNGVNPNEQYEGSFDTDPFFVTWDLEFVLKGYYYGAVSDNNAIIKTANVSIFDSFTATTPLELVNVRPGLTANGLPTTNTSQSVAVSAINAEDNWDFIVDFVSDV